MNANIRYVRAYHNIQERRYNYGSNVTPFCKPIFISHFDAENTSDSSYFSLTIFDKEAAAIGIDKLFFPIIIPQSP